MSGQEVSAANRKYLEVCEGNTATFSVGRYPKPFAVPVLRETKDHFVTPEVISFGLRGTTPAQHKQKIVKWSKKTMLRAGDCPCHYTPGLLIRKVHTKRPPDSVLPVLGE
jgi:hypothetical protein